MNYKEGWDAIHNIIVNYVNCYGFDVLVISNISKEIIATGENQKDKYNYTAYKEAFKENPDALNNLKKLIEFIENEINN